MESIYIPEISQYEPGVVEGGVEYSKDANTYDVRVSIITVHPTDDVEISKFEGYSATVFLHPRIDIKSFARCSPKERDEFRQKSQEYAGICASLAMMPWPNTDLVLLVDHAGELISRYLSILREVPSAEVRREKTRDQDSDEKVVRVILPPNIDIMGKNIYLLDEFIGSGYTLRIIIDEIYKAGGRVNGIGVIGTLYKTTPELEKQPYNLIPIRTLVRNLGD
jgi:hypothetical protein